MAEDKKHPESSFTWKESSFRYPYGFDADIDRI